MLDTGKFNHLASTAKRIGSGEFSLYLNEELMRFSDARSLALQPDLHLAQREFAVRQARSCRKYGRSIGGVTGGVTLVTFDCKEKTAASTSLSIWRSIAS
jgi:hypothetical protein